MVDKAKKTYLEFPANIVTKPHMTFIARPYSPVSIANKRNGTVEQTKGDALWSAVLYIPSNYADAIGSSWGSESLSFNAQAAAEVINNLQGSEYVAAGGIALSAMGQSAAAALAKAPGGKQIATAFAYNTGQALVPNQAMILESASHYELSLTWELNPNNQQEAIAIRKLTQLFKSASTPSVGTLGFLAVLKYPPIFDIIVQTADPSVDFSKPARRKGDTAGRRVYKNMILTTYSASYGGSSSTAMFYPDGESISTTMQLNFKSLRPGYSEQDQGDNTGGSNG